MECELFNMKTTKDFYNKTAEQWADKWYGDEAMLPYLTEFMSYLPKSPKVLDLCCGTGYESMRLHRLGAQVTGVDFSEESIKIAKERNPQINFAVEDMLKDYSYLGKFHGCVVIAGLVHLPNEKLSKAFEMISKALNKGGYLFIAVKVGIGKSDKSSFTSIEGEEYDREFYLHTLEELKAYSLGSFVFLKELQPDEESQWKYYIFKKWISLTSTIWKSVE
jgi:2-polyprenyl-3-methyl-5-hydroxy-6-metoxy-1,4-benzoquinol methylase